MEAAPQPDGMPEATPAKTELPNVQSPPLSPACETQAGASETPASAIEPAATPEPVIEPVAVQAPAVEPIALAAPTVEPAVARVVASRPRFVLRPRHKRYALLAASVTFAAAFGAVIGAAASSGFSAAPAAVAHPDTALIQQNKAMEHSIARLGNEVASLKANLEQANKSAHTQIAKISERLQHASADVTGSISAPQTTAPAPQAAAAQVPTPLPRSAPRVAAVETQPPARTSILQGWTIRDFRRGYVYVENHGEIYQVVLGAALPGLGPVQSVKRQDGRWVVLTPKGIIVAMRDRRYFEDF
jgi:hypothetical protein